MKIFIKIANFNFTAKNIAMEKLNENLKKIINLAKQYKVDFLIEENESGYRQIQDQCLQLIQSSILLNDNREFLLEYLNSLSTKVPAFAYLTRFIYRWFACLDKETFEKICDGPLIGELSSTFENIIEDLKPIKDELPTKEEIENQEEKVEQFEEAKNLSKKLNCASSKINDALKIIKETGFVSGAITGLGQGFGRTIYFFLKIESKIF